MLASGSCRPCSVSFFPPSSSVYYPPNKWFLPSCVFVLCVFMIPVHPFYSPIFSLSPFHSASALFLLSNYFMSVFIVHITFPFFLDCFILFILFFLFFHVFSSIFFVLYSSFSLSAPQHIKNKKMKVWSLRNDGLHGPFVLLPTTFFVGFLRVLYLSCSVLVN